ncbi:hypothetical protein Salat_1878000 [Sesamum alatum]|uniref:Uncharacterized protein n=1 Tax=Sesamum alatum TaxID=300844 RepID=A0AAE1Y460_9LAMI|nr:hypothetical protein Salat_1878000 [Sesamum alatum]
MGSSLSTSSGSKEGDRGDPYFRSLLYGGSFLSYQECVGETMEDGLDREAMLMPLLYRWDSHHFQSEAKETRARVYVSQVSQEVKSGSRSVEPPPPSVISNLNSLFVF